MADPTIRITLTYKSGRTEDHHFHADNKKLKALVADAYRLADEGTVIKVQRFDISKPRRG